MTMVLAAAVGSVFAADESEAMKEEDRGSVQFLHAPSVVAVLET